MGAAPSPLLVFCRQTEVGGTVSVDIDPFMPHRTKTLKQILMPGVKSKDPWSGFHYPHITVTCPRFRSCNVTEDQEYNLCYQGRCFSFGWNFNMHINEVNRIFTCILYARASILC